MSDVLMLESSYGRLLFFLYPLNVHIRVWFVRKYTYMCMCQSEKWPMTQKLQFQVMEAVGLYRLKAVIVKYLQLVHPDFAKQNKIPVLTNIHSILYPLDDVKGILHIALQNVKLHIVTAIVVGSKGWHCGSQEHNFCWKITIRQTFEI